MRKNTYSAPETEVFPLLFMEDVCNGPTGSVPDYDHKSYNPDWDYDSEA